MAVLIILLILLALWHYIYEFLLAPSLRLSIKHQLHSLQDDIRWLKIYYGDTLPDEVYWHLDESIKFSLQYQESFSLSMFLKFNKILESNQTLQERIQVNQEKIEGCSLDEVRQVSHEAVDLTSYAFLVNSGGLLLYILPFIPSIFAAGYFSRRIGVRKRNFPRVLYSKVSEVEL